MIYKNNTCAAHVAAVGHVGSKNLCTVCCNRLLRFARGRVGERTGGCTPETSRNTNKASALILVNHHAIISVCAHTHTHTPHCATAISFGSHKNKKNELTAAANNSISWLKKMPNCEANWSCAAPAPAPSPACCPPVVQKPNGGASLREWVSLGLRCNGRDYRIADGQISHRNALHRFLNEAREIYVLHCFLNISTYVQEHVDIMLNYTLPKEL